MAIKAEISTKTPCEVVIKAAVGREELANAYQESLKKNARQIELPGFRRGKAPLEMVEKRFKEYFENDAVDTCVNQVFRSLIKQYRLNPVTEPRTAETPKFPAEGDLQFTLEFQVSPSIKDVKYAGLKLKSRKQEVTEDEIDKEIAQAAERYASYEDLKSERPAQFGDWTVVSYKATCSGKEVFERKSAWAEVAQDRKTPVPGFCAELAGLKKGESKTFTLNSGDEFFMKEFAGKDLEFTVSVESIKERVVPAIDDELAKKIDPESKSLEEFRGKVKEAFLQNKSEVEQNRLCELVREQLIKDNPIPLPPAFVAITTQNILKSELQGKVRSGLKEEEIAKEMEKIRPECEKRAKDDLTADYILEWIGAKENITVSFDDLLPRIQEYSRMFGKPAAWIFRMFEQTGKLGELSNGVQREKVLRFIVSKSEVTVE